MTATQSLSERLRELAAHLWDVEYRIRVDEDAKTILEAAEEIERLRTVLESLTKDPPSSLAGEPDTDCEVVLKMREIARVALGDK